MAGHVAASLAVARPDDGVEGGELVVVTLVVVTLVLSMGVLGGAVMATVVVRVALSVMDGPDEVVAVGVSVRG